MRCCSAAEKASVLPVTDFFYSKSQGKAAGEVVPIHYTLVGLQIQLPPPPSIFPYSFLAIISIKAAGILESLQNPERMSCSDPATFQAQVPSRSESLPRWTADSRSPFASESLQYLPMSTYSSEALYSPISLGLTDEAVSSWPSHTDSVSFSAYLPSSQSPTSQIVQLASAGLRHGAAAEALVTSSAFSSLPTSDSSSPSSSSPTVGLTPQPEHWAPRRRYERLAGLSHEQRVERRRHSHRVLDTVRRHREALVIGRLEQLTSGRGRTHSSPQTSPPRSSPQLSTTCTVPEGEAEQSTDNGKKGKRHRTKVLEQSVERLEELQQLVQHLTSTCARQSRDIAALRLELHSTGWQRSSPSAQTNQAVSLLSASNIRRLVAELGAQSLYSAMFVSPSVGLLLLAVGSGIAVDVNERLLSIGQSTREDIVGRQIAPTYQRITTHRDWDNSQTGEPASQLHTGKHPAIMFGHYTQYGASKEDVLAMAAGKVDKINVMWRAQLGDGFAYEVPLCSFVASREEVEGGRPRTVVVVLSLSEAKRI